MHFSLDVVSTVVDVFDRINSVSVASTSSSSGGAPIAVPVVASEIAAIPVDVVGLEPSGDGGLAVIDDGSPLARAGHVEVQPVLCSLIACIHVCLRLDVSQWVAVNSKTGERVDLP